uniref:NF-kappa-B essential modulator NEMO CC2-LZ domain-containing protein n=1 Tax=Timema bartmani TaxID=61472 RepID=A0A7R9F542_9NEOP|nr:unnamed protein product [Timema bartmani]
MEEGLEMANVRDLVNWVEVYQSDFNAEREARERLVGEKDQLAEDLRHLQRRNQQLIDDLSKYQQTPNRQPPTSTTAKPRHSLCIRGPDPQEILFHDYTVHILNNVNVQTNELVRDFVQSKTLTETRFQQAARSAN